MKTIVIALGGNALMDPSNRQSVRMENRNIMKVSKSIARLCKKGDYKIVITHGNGSQVGDELIRNEHAKKYVPKLPFSILNAETQASIGTIIETSLLNSLDALGISRQVYVVLAHVEVDGDDKAFRKPSKPIGPFYNIVELRKELEVEKFDYVKESVGYRMVVASPMPKRILELDAIKSHEEKEIVITCGGGGIPVVKRKRGFVAVNAVIDKDLTSRLLANSIDADILVILTNADCVYKDYRKRKGPIKSITARELKRSINDFEEGTIKPKISACIGFVEKGGKEAYIGNVFKLGGILKGRSGTKIVKR